MHRRRRLQLRRNDGLKRMVRAAVLPAPGRPAELREFPVPDPEPGEIVLETLASEVCGTDVHLREGRLAGVPYPIIPGHVSVGRIAAANRVVHDAGGNPIAEGSVVSFFDVHGACNACHQCLVASSPTAARRGGCTGSPVPRPRDSSAAGRKRSCSAAGSGPSPLPDEISVDDLIGGGCGLFTGFAAVDRADLRLGDSVVVQGVGPVGLAAIAFARTSGAGVILAVGEPAERRSLALRMGADEVLSLDGADPEERTERTLAATGGRGADLVIEASGNPRAVSEGFDLLRDGGRYVIAGHYTDAGAVPVNPHRDINRKHAEVRGQWGSEFHHWKRALDTFVRYRERMPFAEVIGKRYRLEDANTALDEVAALRVTKAVITP